jgi:beta-glucanase (GH16 family)
MKMKMLLPVLFFIVLFLACGETKSEPVVTTSTPAADFIFTPKNSTDSANYIVFTSQSKDIYSSLVWSLEGETIQQDTIVTYYFPKQGTYPVELTLFLTNGSTATVTKNVTIAADDPNYVPNRLIWSDEFDSTGLNMNNWSYETGDSGWGNNEWENYTTQNATVSNGMLSIVAKLVGPGQHVGDYTSSRINTSDKKEFLYGRVEVRAKLPTGKGTWPAFWMLGTDIGTIGWPACGELDIMENVGYDPTWIQGTVHTLSDNGNTVNFGRVQVPDCDTTYHIYGMIWTPSKIEYYIDDPSKPYCTYNPVIKNASNWPFDKPCFIILNLAIGGNWGGVQGVDDSIFPQTYSIDYVRVYSYQ